MKTEKQKHRFLGLILLVILMGSCFMFSLKIPPVHAYSEFNETETFEAWNLGSSGTNQWYGDISNGYVVTNYAHSGTKSYRSFTDSSTWAYSYFEHASMLNVYADTWFYLQSDFTMTSGLYTIFFDLRNAGGTGANPAIYYGIWNNGGTIRCAYGYGNAAGDNVNTLASTSAAVVSKGAWHHVTMIISYADAGSASIILDGATIFTATADFLEGESLAASYVKFGGWAGNAGVHYIYFDDVFRGNIGVDVSADLEPDDTGIDWVFTEWKYYTFTIGIPAALYSVDLNFVYMGFTEILTNNGTVGFSIWSDGSNWNSSFNIQFASRDLEPIRIEQSSWSNTSDETVVTFKLWFTSKCLDLWKDEDAVDVLLWFNDTTGADSDWFSAASDFFRIYNNGGFSPHALYTGNAGVLPGGRDFSMFAYNNSYAFKSMQWRDLQHIKMMPTVNFRAGLQTFNVWYGMDYILTDGYYRPGLSVHLEPDVVSYTGVFADDVWINMTASWYNNNSLVKQDVLYMFYHGEVYNSPDPGRWQFWVDLWFDNGNASSFEGGRINAYEYPMNDDSAVWLRWLSSNWGAKDDVLKQSECIVPLSDSDGNTISSENIEFVRVWSSLDVVPYNADQYVAITDFSVFDTTLSQKYPLQAISTPPWDETKMPVVGNTGILGAIWSMFAGIGKWLNENILFGGLSLWPMFVGFLDTIAGWLGAPHFFSDLFTYLGNGWSSFVQSLTYMFTIIADIFIMLGSTMGYIIWTLGHAIVSFASVIGMLAGMIGGSIGGAANLWDQLGLTTWLTLGIILYPIYLVFLWEHEGMDAVISQLSLIWGIMSWLAHFFMDVVRTIITMLSGIIESVPVVE